MLSHDTLNSLVEQGCWEKIVQLTDNMAEEELAQPEFLFFRGMGLTTTGRPQEAIEVIKRGLLLDPGSSWGNKLLFDAYRTNNQLQQAFEGFAQFIHSSSGHESEKAWYVQWASELGLLDLAAEMNEQRSVIRDIAKSPKLALGVQCFCKADTIEKVFASLVGLENSQSFALILLQDSIVNVPKSDRYEQGFHKVKDVIRKWHDALLAKFYSVECLENSRNLGTAPTCRRLLDHISSKYSGFLFIEDDCILAESALVWFEHHINSSIALSRHWFVTCESSYFDREENELLEETAQRLRVIANLDRVKNAFVLLDFVPSTCFGTTSEIWKLCANFRSFTRGPESLTRFVASKGFKTVAPVVPYAADIGMLHELGYSVAHAGAANVREKKGTYLLATGKFDRRFCEIYSGDRDLLFRATSKLDNEGISLLEDELRMRGSE